MTIPLKDKLKGYFRKGRAPSEQEFSELIDSIPDGELDGLVTTEGDLIVGDNAGNPTRYPIGDNKQVLTSNGNTISWETPLAGLLVNPMINPGDTIYLPDDWNTIESHESTGDTITLWSGIGTTPRPVLLVPDLMVTAVSPLANSPVHVSVSFWHNHSAWKGCAFNVNLRRDGLEGQSLYQTSINIADGSAELVIELDDPSPTTFVYAVTFNCTGIDDNYGTLTQSLTSNKRSISVRYKSSADIIASRLPIGSDGQILTVASGLPSWKDSHISQKTPSSSSDTGKVGDVCWDSNYVYVCTATNTWKRSPLTTW
jgi:hypothetical protein